MSVATSDLDPPGAQAPGGFMRHPQSVHVAFPGSNYQIEVFDPTPDVARRLVTFGQLEQVR